MSGLRRTQGGGRPLPPELGAAASQALGQDLSPVRVHTGPEAAALAGSVQAVAFTTGNDIYFSEGSYRPTEAGGQQLIAHELGHIGQDASAGGTIGRADDPAEAQADRAATTVVAALRRSLAANDTIIGDGWLQSRAGNRLSRWSLQTLRRAPVPVVPVARVERKKGDPPIRPTKPNKGTKYKDADYPGLDLEFEDFSTYKIMNPGPRQNTLVYYDDGKYYSVDANMEANYDDPVDMAAACGAVVAVVTRFDNLGAMGKGVSNVAEDTTLRTTGLVSCVGWLLYNATAAYMCHIVVDFPTRVKPDGIKAQVNLLCAKFTQESGSAPTGLRIRFDKADQPAYRNGVVGEGAMAWMTQLQPDNCPPFVDEEGTSMVWVVPASTGGVRKDWDGAPIVLTYSPK